MRTTRARPQDAPAPLNNAAQNTAVIVGASLAGLMTALALSRAGVRVTLLERSDDTGRTGAAIHVEDRLLERIVGPTGASCGREIPAGVQTWFTVHAGLRDAVLADANIRLHPQTAVTAIGQEDASAWATTADAGTFHGNIVIGADGHRSLVRQSVHPQHPHARFAGYLIWLGVAQEDALPANIRWPGEVAYLESGDFILLGYPLPGPDGSQEPGRRQLGWAWYDATRDRLLRESGCVLGDVVQHTLGAQHVPQAVRRDLAVQARESWPAPWRDAILDCLGRHAVIGTPIAEYLPERLVHGRLALVGDAAHVPTPMTGKGFGASLQDALDLAAAVHNQPLARVGPEVLRQYEQRRLQAVRTLVKNGRQFSRYFAAAAADVDAGSRHAFAQ
jgi:2-polyprenyl-6-methoxyphenol hydroxylase-like FAD-dependent oxidoreductase